MILDSTRPPSLITFPWLLFLLLLDVDVFGVDNVVVAARRGTGIAFRPS